jgi:hypothetical protein
MNIVTFYCDGREGFGLEIAFVDHLNTRHVTTLITAPSLISTQHKSLQRTLSHFSPLSLHQSFPGNGF